MQHAIIGLLAGLLALSLAAACGAPAAPQMAVEPTATPLPPTATPLPPTFTPLPTATPLPPTPTPLPPTFTPLPTATPLPPTSTPVPSPTREAHGAAEVHAEEEAAEEGKALYVAKGCAACHGPQAEGSQIALALPGHNAEAVRRQVRSPMGQMPAFGPDKISDEELEKLVAYIISLPVLEVHMEPMDMEGLVEMHHWMAIMALKTEDVPEAVHHVQHIIQLVTDEEHKQRMEHVLEKLEAGSVHEAEHKIEEMLVGKAAPDLALEQMHLRLTLSALEAEDIEDAKHHMEHFVELASGHDREHGEEVLEALEKGEVEAAKEKIEHLLR